MIMNNCKYIKKTKYISSIEQNMLKKINLDMRFFDNNNK